MRAKRKDQEAFSLIELLVALLISIVVVALLWQLGLTGMKARKKADARLQGVQAGMLVIDGLTSDLSQLYVDNGHPMETYDGNKPGLAFWVARAQSTETAASGLEIYKVAYYLNRNKRAIVRESSDGRSHSFKGAFEELHFAIGGLPDDGSDVSTLTRTRGVLSYALVASPEDMPANRVKEEKFCIAATVVKGALPLTQLADGWRNSTWSRNVTSVVLP